MAEEQNEVTCHFDLRGVLQLLHCKGVCVIILQQDGHLKGGRLQSVSVFEAVRDDFALGHVVEPVQFAAVVSVVIEGGETLITAFQLNRSSHA